MGQKHSKWSLHAKPKKTCFAYYEKYTELAASKYPPPAQSSPGASVWTIDSNSTGITEGARRQLADDQINPLIVQEALPTYQVIEIQPAGRIGQGTREAQPVVEEIHEAGPLYLNNSSLDAKKILPKQGALQELEDPFMTPNEQLAVQMAEDVMQEAKIAKITIWNIDDLDSEVSTTTELEEHPMAAYKERAIKHVRLTAAKCVQDSPSHNIEVLGQEKELGVFQETNWGCHAAQFALSEFKENGDESTVAAQMNLQTMEDFSTMQVSTEMAVQRASRSEPQADGMSSIYSIAAMTCCETAQQ